LRLAPQAFAPATTRRSRPAAPMAKVARTAVFALLLGAWAHPGVVAAQDAVAADMAVEAQEPRADVDAKAAPTQLDEDELDVPPPPSAGSIVRHLQQLVTEQLRDPEHQWVNALVAFLFGVVMVLDGESVFKWLVVAAAFVFAGVVTMSDLRAAWAMRDHFLLSHIVGLEVGLVGGYAAWLGFEGLVVIIGGLAGGAVAYYLQDILIWKHIDAFATNGKVIIIFYALFAFAGIVLFRRKRHAKLLAVASSLVGGGLAASAVAWGITFWAVKANAFKALTPESGVWLDFFDLIWNPASKDVGLLAGSKYNIELRGATWRTDRMGTVALAVAFFAVGVVVQLNALKKRATAGAAKAREISPLGEALLSHA